ncbi:ECF transporter S component [Catenibacterium mitsuokai]|uniref:ECF transporter S component n=1 Tax=Catenibacterium mitsuokai TaxID=100886 RepID=UPI0022E24345|nr:ECF transporter S component [Catenibacterium mitsuokai]
MRTKRMTFGAMCLAISLLLPQIFHMIGMQQAGSIFLPMHLPVFIGGLLLGPVYGLLLGIFAPLTSFVITGMPSADRVIFMMCELATYGMVSGFLFQNLQFYKKKMGALIALILSMIAGRIIYGIVISIATYVFGVPLGGIMAVIAATSSGIPGIIIQLIFVPGIVTAIVKGGYLDESATITKNA